MEGRRIPALSLCSGLEAYRIENSNLKGLVESDHLRSSVRRANERRCCIFRLSDGHRQDIEQMAACKVDGGGPYLRCQVTVEDAMKSSGGLGKAKNCVVVVSRQ